MMLGKKEKKKEKITKREGKKREKEKGITGFLHSRGYTREWRT